MSRLDGRAEAPEAVNVQNAGYLYAVGKELNIFSHQPPQPYGRQGLAPPFDKNRLSIGQDFLKSHSPSDLVFAKFPQEREPGSQLPPGATSYFTQQDEATLVITENLDVEDNIGAQVVLCKFKRQSGHTHKPTVYWDKMGFNNRPTEVVAKIYDPLFFPKISSISPWVRLNMVRLADKGYAGEAAAYAEFHEAAKKDPMVRDFVPRFYGTWTTTIKNQGWGRSDTRPSSDADNVIRSERPVRIILMEYIKGTTIWESCRRRYEDGFPILIPRKLGEDSEKDLNRRLNVLARILRGLVALEHIGVSPGDFEAKDIMIADDAQARPNDGRLQPLGSVRAVLINHDHAKITRYSSKGPCDDERLSRPRHPAHSKFTAESLDCLAGWYPREWLDDDKPFREWVRRVFRPQDFASKDEIDAVIAKRNAEWAAYATAAKRGKQPVGLAEAVSAEAAKRSPESAKQSSGSENSPPETKKPRARKHDQSDSSSVVESTFDSDTDLISSVGTLPARRSSSTHSTRPSGLSSAQAADEPTAKKAGKKAADAGLATVAEGGDGEEDQEEKEAGEHHEAEKDRDADDEESPKQHARGRKRDQEQ